MRLGPVFLMRCNNLELGETDEMEGITGSIRNGSQSVSLQRRAALGAFTLTAVQRPGISF